MSPLEYMALSWGIGVFSGMLLHAAFATWWLYRFFPAVWAVWTSRAPYPSAVEVKEGT